jgi:hypothetical protein
LPLKCIDAFGWKDGRWEGWGKTIFPTVQVSCSHSSSLPFLRTVNDFLKHALSLPKLSAAEYLKTKNPVAYGLAPLMDFKNEMSRVELKAACIVSIGECQNLNEVQIALLLHFLETYLKLTPEEETEVQKRIVKEEVTPMQIVNPYVLRGQLKARSEILARQLQIRFGELPPDTVQRVQEIDSIETLDQLLEQVIRAESLEQVELGT